MALDPDDYQASLQVCTTFEERKRDRGGLFNRAEEVRSAYNGTWALPLPELDADEKPAVANLIALGIDEFAQRIGSVEPNVEYPSFRPGFTNSDNRAADGRKAIQGWTEMNGLQTKQRRRGRYLISYGTTPVTIGPVSTSYGEKREIPFWRVRNPLQTFAAPMIDPDDMEPSDAIFVDYRTRSWLEEKFPAQMRVLSKGDDEDTDLFTVLEYVDDVEFLLVVMGKTRHQDPWERASSNRGTAMAQCLHRVPNKAGICPVVIPGRITLDRVQGQFDQALGMYHRQAKLDALNTIAISRNIFPNEWIVSANGRATIVRAADGKRGIRGEIENGNVVVNHLAPDQNTTMALDRLERNLRLTAGIPAEFGGESPTNVRTARRGAAVLSASVDMPLQESQELLARSREHEYTRAILFDKAYYGNKPTMFFMGKDGVVTRPDYVPNDVFKTTVTKVEYPMPGSDINGLVVQIGQLVGIKAMSIETAMMLLPMIKDYIGERDRIEVEGMRTALLSGIEQLIVSGGMDPHAAAMLIMEKISAKVPIEVAYDTIHKKMQQDQADQQNNQPPPGAPAAPEAQPGATESPENPQQPPTPAAPQGGPPSLEDLLGQLHTPINTGAAPAAKVSVG